MEDSLAKIAESHNVITYKPLISLKEAKEIGTPIEWEYGGRRVTACYRIDDSFSVIKLTLHKSEFGPPEKVIYRNAFALLYMNPELNFESLCRFFWKAVNYCTVRENLMQDKSVTDDIMSFCADKDINVEKIKTPAIFFWKTHLPVKEKRSIVAHSINKSISMKNFKLVRQVIENEMEFGDMFITNKLISERAGVSRDTARKYAQTEKDLIDEYNRTVFGTHDFNFYRRIVSIHKITKAIMVLNGVGEKISKANVSRDSGLHYNSILNLWQDEEVQEELDKYNATKEAV